MLTVWWPKRARRADVEAPEDVGGSFKSVLACGNFSRRCSRGSIRIRLFKHFQGVFVPKIPNRLCPRLLKKGKNQPKWRCPPPLMSLACVCGISCGIFCSSDCSASLETGIPKIPVASRQVSPINFMKRSSFSRILLVMVSLRCLSQFATNARAFLSSSKRSSGPSLSRPWRLNSSGEGAR